ncbi:MAG: hypothetical protein H3C47_00095 [Candidatus Cloacimonetes bacterium]|nr:hypothetical protein [Candidatus Cloacimonadota bacterium]
MLSWFRPIGFLGLVFFASQIRAEDSTQSIDFLDGLRQETRAQAQFASTRNTIVLSSTEEQVFYDRITDSVDSAVVQQIDVKDRQLQALDQAVLLPSGMQTKYREEQKRLESLKREYASRFVDAKVARASVKAVIHQKDENPDLLSSSPLLPEKTPVTNAALRVLPQLKEDKEKKAFLNSWKASLVDERARDSFALALSSMQMYGTNSPQTAMFQVQLEQYASEFSQRIEKQSKVVMTEADKTEFFVQAVRDHSLLLTLPARRNVERIVELEQAVQASVGRNELELNLKKLEWEKGFLIKNLERDGLKLQKLDVMDIEAVDMAFFSWFQNKMKQGKTLKWPLEEPGVVKQNFHPDRPFIQLVSLSRPRVLAPCDSQVTIGERSLSFTCHATQITFEGDFQFLVKDNSRVKAKDPVALFKNPPRELFITTILESREMDFLSFF